MVILGRTFDCVGNSAFYLVKYVEKGVCKQPCPFVTFYTDFMSIVGHMLQIDFYYYFMKSFHSVDQKRRRGSTIRSNCKDLLWAHEKICSESKDIDLYNTN